MTWAPLDDIPGTRLVAVEADGLRQQLSFVPGETTVGQVIETVGRRAQVRDLTVQEPDIDDVIRRLYIRSVKEPVES